MKYLIIALLLVLSISALLIAAAVLIFRFACLRKDTDNSEPGGSWKPFEKELKADRDWLRKNHPEKITLDSYDKLKLVGYYFKTENAKGTIIAFHGYRSNYDVDFAPEVRFFRSLGYNVLLPTMRAHGESQGKYITFGIKERYDCKTWIDYIIERSGNNHTIFTAGISMGAATVLMASGFRLPKNVKGIIADCGFTSPWEITKSVAKNTLKIPTFPLLYIANLVAIVLAGFSLKEYSTFDAMAVNKTPVLFIHGDIDTFVPTYMTKQNYDACIAEKRLVIIKDSPHAVNYYTDKTTYESAVKDFIETYS